MWRSKCVKLKEKYKYMYPLTVVHGKSNEPYFTLLVVKSVHNGD